MFTGLVETAGIVLRREEFEEGIRFRLSAPDLAGTLSEGDSLSIDGVCHTVFAIEGEEFSFESVRTTLLSLIHISEPTRQPATSRMPSSA